MLRFSNSLHCLFACMFLTTHALARRAISQPPSIVSPSSFMCCKVERGSLCALNACRRKVLGF